MLLFCVMSLSSLFWSFIYPASRSMLVNRCSRIVFIRWIMSLSGIFLFSIWWFTLWWVMPFTFRFLFLFTTMCSFPLAFRTLVIITLVNFILIRSSFPSFVFFCRRVIITVPFFLVLLFLFWFLYLLIFLLLCFILRLPLFCQTTDFSPFIVFMLLVCNSYL